MKLAELKTEARDRNLTWSVVQAAYGEIKLAETAKREQPRAVRQMAWCMATSEGCHSFWGLGFQNRWGKRAAELDYTIVPHYDEIAQEISWEFPEYANDDGAERLFNFLFSPYDRMPFAESMYRQAMDMVEFELVASEPVDYSFESDF